MLSQLLFSGLLGFSLAAQQQPLKSGKQSVTPFDDEFNEKADWIRDHFDIPGLAIAVVENETIHSKGYGQSNIEQSLPTTDHTLFFTGSTTKAHTAAAISLLVDDDENYPTIQWDTPVHSIIPDDFVLDNSWSTTHITITDMLSHRSGLPRHDFVWNANISLQEVVRSMRYLPLTAEPRTEYQYCNLMYMTAAHLVESVTGMSIHEFLTEKIWGPLNMSETYLSVPAARNAGGDISEGYYITQDGDLKATNQANTDTVRGAGNTLSSVSDYAKWISAILHRRPPISEAGYKALLSAHSIMLGSTNKPYQSPMLYGFGWMSQTYAGETIVYHGGAQFGYGASVLMIPERKFGLVIFGNNMNGIGAGADPLAFHLVDKLLGVKDEERFDWIERGDAMINGTHLPSNVIPILYPSAPNPPLPNPLPLSAYEGTYTHPAYPDVQISLPCPTHAPKLNETNRTSPDICASFMKPSEYTPEIVLGLYHVTGTFWVQIMEFWGIPVVSRIEFKVEADGTVGWMGIEAEPMMAVKGEKIWWKRV